jgi:hypothetical protein
LKIGIHTPYKARESGLIDLVSIIEEMSTRIVLPVFFVHILIATASLGAEPERIFRPPPPHPEAAAPIGGESPEPDSSGSLGSAEKPAAATAEPAAVVEPRAAVEPAAAVEPRAAVEPAAAVEPRAAEPGKPESSRRDILGKGLFGADVLSSFLLSANGGVPADFVRELADFYVEEAGTEGVNHDIAFAQMCLETGFLRYGGLVTPDMNNFCGLGSIGPGQNGESFPSARIGVRAHIQHLKAYATDKPLKGELVDPRNRWVRKGSAPALQDLAGTWAADTLYADKIEVILERLYQFPLDQAEPNQLPVQPNLPAKFLPAQFEAPEGEAAEQ